MVPDSRASGHEISQAWHDDGVASRLAGGIRAQRAEEAVGEARVFEQVGELRRDVRANLVWRLRHLIDQLLAPVDEREDVAEVSAAEKSRLPRPLKASSFVASR